MSTSRPPRRFVGSLSILGILGIAIGGCEDLDVGAAAPTAPTGAQSTLGKAKEKAERTVDQINRHQQDLVRQADTVFDDQAARELEAERRAAERGD